MGASEGARQLLVQRSIASTNPIADFENGTQTPAAVLECVGTARIGTTPVKLVDLVLLVLIACALIFLFWQLSELARYL
jgi:hypothetical protein